MGEARDWLEHGSKSSTRGWTQKIYTKYTNCNRMDFSWSRATVDPFRGILAIDPAAGEGGRRDDSRYAMHCA
jgi:hypothetical protein